MKLAWTVLSLGLVGARARFTPSHVSPRGLANKAAEMELSPKRDLPDGILDGRAAANTTLDPNAMNCQITVPNNPLTAKGLSTPWLLQPPCSMAVATQQSFVEAAIYDPATNTVSVYHPLVIDAGTKPAADPVQPKIPDAAAVATWQGFNGGVLTLIDTNGLDTNNSPLLKGAGCINGLQGTQNDVFGQVSWCNAQPFFAAVNKGGITIPPLGTDNAGKPCPTTRSFEIVDACPSDNVATQYFLLPNGQTAQFTNANKALFPNATVINNASDEALVAHIIDPLVGCQPFLGPSLDDPTTPSAALALSELQAAKTQLAPLGIVPINNPDCLLTNGGGTSVQKTNQYRLGVNQPVVNANDANTSGALIPYCNNMITVAPPFFANNMANFINQPSPAPCVGNNLFTFMCQRYIMSLTQLTCPVAMEVNPVKCAVDGNGVATSCSINLPASTGGAMAAGANAPAAAPSAAPTGN
jgi:hypothetical protein